MSEKEKIEAYGINEILSVEAEEGLIIINALMRGGAEVHFAMIPRISRELRPMLRDAERAANIQRNERAALVPLRSDQ